MSASITILNFARQIMRKYGIVVILVLMVIILSILEPVFLTPVNILNILVQTSIFGIMALGMTFVIISRGIDLSVGSVLALSGVVTATLAQVPDATILFLPNLPVLPIFVPVLTALLIGGACGAVNGLLVAKAKIPPFIATLGMMVAARGFALIYTGGRPVFNMVPGITFFGSNLFGVIPVPIIVYFLLIVVSYILLNKTRFGKNVYAIGGNITAAEVSGVNVPKNQILIFTYCGLLAGIAALVFLGRVGGITPGSAEGFELTAIAATTIGGTSHAGGVGTIGGAFVGAMVLSVLRNGFTLLGVSPHWQRVAEGVIIVAAVVVDMRKNTKRE